MDCLAFCSLLISIGILVRGGGQGGAHKACSFSKAMDPTLKSEGLRARRLAQRVPGSSIVGQRSPRACRSNELLDCVWPPVFCCWDMLASSHASFQAACLARDRIWRIGLNCVYEITAKIKFDIKLYFGGRVSSDMFY